MEVEVSEMETNYRIAYDNWWQDLKRKVPEEIATQLAVTYFWTSGGSDEGPNLRLYFS